MSSSIQDGSQGLKNKQFCPHGIPLLLMVQKSCTSWYGKYPIIYRVSYIAGGVLAGFLNHQRRLKHAFLHLDDSNPVASPCTEAIEGMRDRPWCETRSLMDRSIDKKTENSHLTGRWHREVLQNGLKPKVWGMKLEKWDCTKKHLPFDFNKIKNGNSLIARLQYFYRNISAPVLLWRWDSEGTFD